MSFFNWAAHARGADKLDWLWGRVFSAQRKRRPRPKHSRPKHRALCIDPLEDRCLLSVAPSLTPILVNQTFGSQQVTTTSQSIAADNNGDFVVAWTRFDNVTNSSGLPIIDPATGNQLTVSDVYARYFTNEVQQVSLPGPGSTNTSGTTLPNGIASNFDNDPNSIGTFSLTFNTQTELMISVTAGTAPAGDPTAPLNPNIAGQFTLWFDANGDGKITANEVTTINFDETNPTVSAKTIQTWLNTFGPISVGGKLVSDGSHAVVTAIDPHDYLVDFGTATQGLDQSSLLQYLSPTDSRVPGTVPTPAFTLTGFLPSVSISVQARPFTVNNVPVSQTDPNQTARAIENYFQTRAASFTSGAAPFEFPIASQIVPATTEVTWAPYIAPVSLPTNSSGGPASVLPQSGFNPNITVVPVVNPDGTLSYTDFTVTFTGASGDQIEAPLLITNCVDEDGVPIGQAVTIPVTTTDATSGTTVVVQQVTGWTETAVSILKESSPEFQVNPKQTISSVFQPVPSVLASDQPAVAMDASGDFVVAWREAVSQSVAPKDVTNIYYRHFSPTGITSSYNPGTFVPGQTLDGAGQVTDDSGNPISQVRMLPNPLLADVQQITFNATNGATLPVTGSFELEMDGVTTAPIAFNGADLNGTAVNIEAALSNIGKPATVVSVLPSIQPGKPGVYVFKITFAGTSLGIDEPPLQYVPVVDSSGNTMPVNFAQASVTTDLYTVQADTNFTNPQQTPAVAMDPQGNFNIVWATQGQDLSFFNDIEMQRFDRDGNRLGAEITVNVETTSTDELPDIAMGIDDVSVVTWTTTDTPNSQISPSLFAVKAHGFGATGNTLWTSGDWNIGGGGDSTVAMDGNDDFVVIWDEFADPDLNGQQSDGVYGVKYAMKNAAGTLLPFPLVTAPMPNNAPANNLTNIPEPYPFRLNSATPNVGPLFIPPPPVPTPPNTVWPFEQFNSQAVMDLDGDFAASYEGYGPAVTGGNEVNEGIDIPATFFRPYFKLNTDTSATGSQNQDLLPYFNPFPHAGTTGDTLGFDTVASVLSPLYNQGGVVYNVDTAIDQVLFDAKYPTLAGLTVPAATDEQLGRLRNILESVAGELRGDSDGIMTSIWNASPNFTQGPNSSDDIVNTQRSGTDQRYYVVFGPDAEVGSITLQLAVTGDFSANANVLPDIGGFISAPLPINVPEAGGQFGPIDAPTVEQNIATALDNALGNIWPATQANTVTFSANVREVTLAEFDARAGTDWDISGIPGMPSQGEVDGNLPPSAGAGAVSHPYVIYEITFQGAAHDVPIDLTVRASNLQHWYNLPGQMGAVIPTLMGSNPAVAVEGDYTGVQSEPSFDASAAMTSEGDMYFAYTHQFLQTDTSTPLDADGNAIQQNIYVEPVLESTNTAGPQLVDWSDGTTDNKHFLNATSVSGVNSVQFFVLTFDQPMLAGDPSVNPDSVLNPANYNIVDANGNIISNAIAHVDYGLSEVAEMAGSYGLNPVPSGKYEIILTLDANPNSPGNQPLTPGTYSLQINQAVPANSTTAGQTGLRNIYGTPMYLSGFNPTGNAFNQTITIGTASPPGPPGLAAQDIPINAQRGGQQIDPSTAAALDGSYIVAWTSIVNGQTNIVAQRFNSNNVPILGEFTVNTTASTTWGHPDVAMDPSGAFVITWSGGGPGTDLVNNPSDVYARRFNAVGQAIGGQFLVNQFLSSVQNASRVAMAPDGSFVITWESYGQGSVASATTVNYAIYAREYSANGTPVNNSTFQPGGNEFKVSAASPFARTLPDVSMDAADDFVIVWSGDFQQQSTWGVYGNYFFGATGKSTGELLLSTSPNQRGTFNIPTTFDLSNTGPRVGMASNTGDFVVTWANYTPGTTTGFNIFAREFAPGGVPLAGTPSAAGPFQVNEPPTVLQPNLNPPTISWQLMPAVGVDASGNFTIVWTSFGQDNAEVNNPSILDYGVYARMYLANGTDFFDTAQGSFPLEYRVNATTLGNQVAPAVNRGDAAGDSEIVWVGPDTAAVGTTAIYFRVVDPPSAAPAVHNAPLAPRPTITVANATVTVGSSAAKETFTVTLSGPTTTKPVSFAYSTADGTAKAGKNYTTAIGTLTFAAGQRSQTITVNIPAMTAGGQPNLNYQLNLKTPINGVLAQTSATATIVDGLTTTTKPPVVTTNPISQRVLATIAVNFTAAATGAATTQWQSSANGGSTWNNIFGANSSTYSVTAAAAIAGYQYRALFTNASGSVATTAATLTVDAPITITSNPQSTSAAANASVKFTTSAIGTPAPTVQWQLSTDNAATWTNIAGATTTSYTLTVTAAMSGYKYRAVFTSVFGTAATSPATLTISTGSVSATPVITANPVSHAAAAGAMVNFTAAATNATSTQWQLSTNGGSTWTNITGATAATYSVTAAATMSGYQYRVLFTNSSGSVTTSPATLTVGIPITITSNPQSTSAAANASVTFTTSAIGTPAPTVQWQLSTDSAATWTNIAGATTTSYTLTVTAAMSGYKYRAVFTSVFGTAATSPATLTISTGSVSATPVITANPVSHSAAAGATVNFTAAATGATSTQWQLSTNGGSTWTNIASATSSAYSVTAATTMSGYQYRVLFTNSSGSVATSPATLTVGAPITITMNPLSKAVPANTAVTFTTAATGTPAPAVQWQVSSNNAVTWTNITGATSTSYTVTATAAISGYQYRAVFTSSLGIAATSPATLSVSAGLVVQFNPASQTAIVGQSISFTATASGSPSPTVQWQFSSNGTTWVNIPGATATTFKLTVAATQNGYQFRAVFANSGGTAISSAAKLTVTTTAAVRAAAVVQAASVAGSAVTNASSLSSKTSLNAAAVDAVMTRLS